MGEPTFDNWNFEAVRLRVSWTSGFGFPVIIMEVSNAEYIGVKKQTQGTETSKYLEERTSTETPLVVASERGSGQRFN